MDSNISFPERWTAPPELIGPLQRETRLSRDGIGTAIGATAFLLAAIAIVLWAGAVQTKQTAHTAALRREGAQTAGRHHCDTPLRHRRFRVERRGLQE